MKSQQRNKDEMENTQGRWAPTETVGASWEELGNDLPQHSQSPVWLESGAVWYKGQALVWSSRRE